MKLGLRSKILVLFSITILLVILVNLNWIGRILRNEYKAALDTELMILSDNLKSQLSRIADLGINVRDIENFDELCLEAVKKNPDILAAMVIDTEGVILFHNNRYMRGTKLPHPELLTALQENRSGVYQVTEDQSKIYYAVTPFRKYTDQPEFGILISSPVSIIHARVHHLVQACNLIFLTAFGAVALLLLIGLNTMLTAPLSHILHTIQQIITHKDLRQRVKVESGDEIGQLADSFNRMIEELEQTTASVEDLNQEISSRLQAEQQVQQAGRRAHEANRVKNAFLAGMSRDIREPIDRILRLSEQLCQEGLDEEQQVCAKNIAAGGRNLRELINKILDYSKMEAACMDLRIAECPLGDLLEDLNTVVKEQVKNSKVELSMVRHEQLPVSIQTDQARLRQCLLSLLKYAIRYTREGRIGLYVYPSPESDLRTGPMISFDLQVAICCFDAEQVRNISDSQAQGLSVNLQGGIDLTIAQKLAELLSGRLLVSCIEDQGVTFTLLIPEQAGVEN